MSTKFFFDMIQPADDELRLNATPMLSNGKTAGGNVLGNKGVVDDLLFGGAGDQSMTQAQYNNVFARGGIINNLADGYGVGAEYATEPGTQGGDVAGPGGPGHVSSSELDNSWIIT